MFETHKLSNYCLPISANTITSLRGSHTGSFYLVLRRQFLQNFKSYKRLKHSTH